MCGIVGVVTREKTNELIDNIKISTELLSHRGPNTSGVRISEFEWCDVITGMSRLKIVDQCNLMVPYGFTYCGVTIVFNGEIYNWKELREELYDGKTWETNCDVEVIARAWRKWGPAALHKFNGMFAFCLIDSLRREIFIARDRAGEKPLYYSVHNESLYFTSEIKALPFQLDETYCAELECLEFDCVKETPFKNVFTLGPGEYLHFKNPEDYTNPHPWSWWSLGEINNHCDSDYEDIVEELQSLIVDAVKIRTTSEVPVALLLSGGLDSSIIQHIAKINDLYCCDFSKDGINNIDAAQLATCGGALSSVTFNYTDLMDELQKIVYYLDTPATWTAIAQWFLFRAISDDKKVIVLSGEGADELFYGYTRYRILWHLDNMNKDTLLSKFEPTTKYLFGDKEDILAKLLNRSNNKTLNTASKLISSFSLSDNNLVENMARVDFYTTMQVLLRMADRMAAAFSLENRSPFLDYRIMELSTKIPTEYKINNTRSKSILRDVASMLGVHKDIVNEKSKLGLCIPFNKWHTSDNSKPRGIYGRSSFANLIKTTWKEVFFKNNTVV